MEMPTAEGVCRHWQQRLLLVGARRTFLVLLGARRTFLLLNDVGVFMAVRWSGGVMQRKDFLWPVR
jgi:hypothetical protein